MVPESRSLTNLDIRCAEAGRLLSEIKAMDEKILNEALAVLEEQGPYAMFLYIEARHKRVAKDFEEPCVRLLQEVFGEEAAADKAPTVIRQLADDLDCLLFARDLLRNALGYARYYLKAKAE